ncbi:hypothetical protein CCMA1212_002967 [Trichoderma ghanense]|uniref:Uncharacterized protein n=1 Tax=Trichoderma ghanense TaxID=65468 RepID=A0ABY2HB23_9HYPO
MFTTSLRIRDADKPSPSYSKHRVAVLGRWVAAIVSPTPNSFLVGFASRPASPVQKGVPSASSTQKYGDPELFARVGNYIQCPPVGRRVLVDEVAAGSRHAFGEEAAAAPNYRPMQLRPRLRDGTGGNMSTRAANSRS